MKQSRFETAVEHHQAGRLTEAEPLYREVLMCEPNHADALHLLGVLAAQSFRFGEATELIGKACALAPNVAAYRRHLGNAMSEKKDFHGAVDAYGQALRLVPDCYVSHDGLGAALRETGQFDEALQSHRRSLALNPNNVIAHLNLGITLGKKGLLQEAIDSYRRAIAIAPNTCDAHWNLSQLLLLLGDYEHGWREYEWRWQRKNFPTMWRALPQPRWTGEELAGKTLLVHTEQGYGDAIQFVRYVPMLAARGARVVLLCQPRMARLLQSVDGMHQIVPGIESPADLPPFDFHCPMMSLPHLFGARLVSVPADTPYLTADPYLMQHWSSKVNGATRGLKIGPDKANAPKVGLVWAGNPEHINDAHRSTTLEQLAPLAGAGATFYSLQKGPAASQATSPPRSMQLIDLTEELQDFADTAALLSNLDLVITVDTAVAHVAGALGKPVWVLIAKGEQDWRWMLDREDTPWYPTMRLFRQSVPGQWGQVVQRVSRALASEYCHVHSPSSQLQVGTATLAPFACA
jgi:Flp pilus assembly protein TadD